MIVLLSFLSSVVGAFIGAKFNFWPLLLLLPLLIIFTFKKRKLVLIPLSFLFFFVLLTFIRKNTGNGYYEGTFIVIKSSSSYLLVSNFISSFYIDIDSSYEIGDIIKVSGYLEEYNYFHYQSSFDMKTYFQSYGVFNILCVSNLHLISYSPLRIRAFQNYICDSLSEEAKATVLSFVFKKSLPSEIYKSLRYTSLNHLFSASSIHIGFLNYLITEKILYKTSSKIKSSLPLITSFIILLLTSFSPSIFRLFLMNLIFLITKAYPKYRLSYIERLCVSGIIYLLINPFYILNTGFYYSYIVLIIFNLSNTLINKRHKYFKLLRSLNFFLLLLPLNLYLNSGFNIFSFFLQFLLTPLLSLIFIIELTIFFKPLSPLLNFFNKFLYNSLLNLDFSFGFIPTGKLALVFVILIYLFFLVSLYLKEIKLRLFYKVSLGISIGLCVIPSLPRIIPKSFVSFIDVGQGDATLISHRGTNVLIDTGGSLYNDLAISCLIPYFYSLKIYSLDAILITHEDYDHVGALDSLRSNFPVNDVYLDTPEEFKIGDIYFKNLNIYKSNSEDENYNSSIFKFEIKDTSFLIMGDAPIEIERKLISSNIDIDVDYLKLGHHGSKTSTCDEFLIKTSPRLAVISCGYNNYYNHPDSIVISNLMKHNIDYHRTDLSGTFLLNL